MGTGNTDFMYGKARAAFAQAQIDWLTAAVNVMLVSSVYSPSPNTDQFVSDIPADAILIRDVPVTAPGVTSSGACFCTIPPFNAFAASAIVRAVVLYVLSGADNTSKLLYYSSTGSGFPFLAQGFNYVIGYDQSNGGFFQV